MQISQIMNFLKKINYKKQDNSGDIENILNQEGSFIDNKNQSKIEFYDINTIFEDAIKLGASDIHIEPDEKNLNIRLRIDGHLINYKTLDENAKSSLVARIKVLGGLKIDEHRLPQDGKASYKEKTNNKDIDLRINTIPTIYGEKIAIRILKKQSEWIDLKNIGILPMNMVKIKKQLNNNFGLCLVVGPTGSGKSTTLYSMLSTFDPSENNISTLEDPVEYRIKGVNHTQINPAIGFNFADGLRNLLRQDPDIIMVGEIRDSETAKLAVEASITGHLVFSTMHANSSVSTVQRLVNLGVDPLLIVSSLKMVISQRLARKLCTNCKIQYEPEQIIKNRFLEKIGKYINNAGELRFFKASESGCEKCNFKGYKGRIGLYEILEMTEGLEKLILAGASNAQLEIQAIGDGMITIKNDALLKIALGEISLEEVISVLGN
ncbi:type II/IV secretion system protein [Candidatus Gracilibacteria bacterium]|nr:type II/IV secretion system protein [Candidatus Gracilibacteria bacterium]